MHKVFLKNNINTDVVGYKALMAFYKECKELQNCEIEIDLTYLTWLDANLCGLWLAMINDLKITNNLSFRIDQKHWLENPKYYPNNFHVIFRNKFISLLSNMEDEFNDYKDPRQSTIELRCFTVADVDSFIEYIENEFLEHRGCQISKTNKEDLYTAYAELFANYEIHSKTQHPIYVCGQYFSKNQQLMFSFTDVGVGFAKPIYEYTKINKNPIKTPLEAVKWAIEGHTTKQTGLGGSGLKSIEEFCKHRKGNFHIITDGIYTYYDANKKRVFETQDDYFKGVTVHLLF
jgi:hypothetical protein